MEALALPSQPRWICNILHKRQNASPAPTHHHVPGHPPKQIARFSTGLSRFSIVSPIGIIEYTTPLIRERASSALAHFPLLSAARSVEMGRSRGLVTPPERSVSTAMTPPQPYRVGEASAYVQSFGLKAVAVVSGGLRTPRSPEGNLGDRFTFGFGGVRRHAGL